MINILEVFVQGQRQGLNPHLLELPATIRKNIMAQIKEPGDCGPCAYFTYKSLSIPAVHSSFPKAMNPSFLKWELSLNQASDPKHTGECVGMAIFMTRRDLLAFHGQGSRAVDIL